MKSVEIWKKEKLKKFTIKIGSGITPKGGQSVYKDKGIPFIRSQNVHSNYLDLDDVVYIDNNQHQKMSSSIVQSNDVLLNITGASIGRSCVVPNTIEEANVNQHVCIIRVKQALNPYFLATYLNSWYGQRQIWSFQGGGSREGLNYQQIGGFNIPNIPRKYQDLIATLLSTWDLAIEKTERLIEAKEKRLQWLIKSMISNQTGKSGWRKVKLGEVGEITSAGVDKNENPGERKAKLLNYLDVLGRDYIYSHELTHWVTAPDRQILNCDIRLGDIFFTPSSEFRGDIAHSAVAMEDIKDGVYSYHIVRFRLKEDWDLKYRAFAFKDSNFYKQAYCLCEGSGQRYVISQRYFREMTVWIPSQEIQEQIASILESAQQEISHLRNLAKNYQKQKRGLMHNLLTGHWRVNQNVQDGN